MRHICGVQLEVMLCQLIPVFFRCSCYTAQYTAKWAHESEFSEILIGGKMLTDHMPDVLIRALDRVSNRDACISCPATGGSA